MCIKTSSVWSFFVGQSFYFLKYKFLTRLESYKEGIQATNDGEKRGYRRYTNFAVERHFRSSAPGNMTILSLFHFTVKKYVFTQLFVMGNM